jgi:hypothetical protein
MLPIPRRIFRNLRPGDLDIVLKKLFRQGLGLVVLALLGALVCTTFFFPEGSAAEPTMTRVLILVLPWLGLFLWGALYLSWWAGYWKARAFNYIFDVATVSDVEIFLDRANNDSEFT